MANATNTWIARYNEIVPHFHQESDRAAAILAASFLESALRERLSEHLVDDSGTKRLFAAYSPLSTFSAVIDMSFALGLMTRNMKSDLALIKKIRNHFAHHPEHTSFGSSPVSDWCRGLTTAKGIPIVDGAMWQAEEPREQFLFSIVHALVYFDRLVGAAGRRVIPESGPFT